MIAAHLPNERLAQLGADAVVDLDRDEDLAAGFKHAAPGGVDVIIDPLWGPPGLAAMGAARHGVRHVQIGQMASTKLTIPHPWSGRSRSTLWASRSFTHPPRFVARPICV